MNRELEEIYNRVLELLEEGTKGQYIDPDDLATAYDIALSKESIAISDKIDDMMQELYPENTLSVLVHARNTAMKGNPIKALSLYESVDINEIEMEHWGELPFASHCAIVAGKRKNALEYFKRYIRHLNGPGEELQLHLSALAVDLYTFGSDFESIAELMEMTVARFRSTDVLLIAASNMAMAHRPSKAVEYLKEASEIEPMNPQVWMMLTRAYLQVMDFDGMRDACRYYMALCPDTREFEMLLIQSDSYLQEGNFELAMESLHKCAHIRGLSKEQRTMLTIATAQAMSGMGEPSKKIVEYLKRRKRIVGEDKNINEMITKLQKEE